MRFSQVLVSESHKQQTLSSKEDFWNKWHSDINTKLVIAKSVNVDKPRKTEAKDVHF